MADGTAQLALLPGATTGLVRWSVEDDTALRAAYAAGGRDAARAALPHRSEAAIYNRAVKLKLRSPRQTGPRRTWPHDERIDREIRSASARVADRGVWTDIARRWGRPQWYISRRAGDLGCALPRNSVGTWTEPEIELLHRTASNSATRAAEIFRKHGFIRTTTAIQHKRWEFSVERGTNGVHTMRGLSLMLGCSHMLLMRAVRAGGLRATRDGQKDDPDAMWMIRERDIRAWLIATPYGIDLRRVPPPNQAWLISASRGMKPEALICFVVACLRCAPRRCCAVRPTR